MKSLLVSGVRKVFTLWLLGVFAFMQVCMDGAFQPAMGELTLSGEKALGRKILGQIRERFTLIEDGETLAYVQAVGNRLAGQLDASPYQFEFFLIDERVPNAFAIPGGYIFLYRGIVEMMESEGELASIIGHELAHIQAQHIKQRLEKGRALSIASLAGLLAGIFLGMDSDASRALSTGVMAGSASMQLKYSRENEEEADQLGFRFFTRAGYDPKDMVSMMSKLNSGLWRANSRIPSYLSTHPAMSERIQVIETVIRSGSGYSAKKTPVRPPVGDFMLMQAALISEYADSDEALARFRKWKEAKEHPVAADYGLGRVYLRNGQAALAIPHLQEAARQKADSPMILSSLGSAYFQAGRIAEAQRTLQSALLLDPNADIVHYRMALILEEQGQREAALQHLRSAGSLSSTLPEVDYHLGVVLGQLNQLGEAHYHLGRYYHHHRDWDTALFHYKKAKALVKDSEEKQEEIDESIEEVRDRRKEKESAERESKRQRVRLPVPPPRWSLSR